MKLAVEKSQVKKSYITVEGIKITSFSVLDSWFIAAMDNIKKIKSDEIRQQLTKETLQALQSYHQELLSKLGGYRH